MTKYNYEREVVIKIAINIIIFSQKVNNENVLYMKHCNIELYTFEISFNERLKKTIKNLYRMAYQFEEVN